MMDSGNRHKERLISELREGKASAFRSIYDMYVDRLFSFVFSLTKSREDAADIVQEVFVRLWESRENISVGKNLEAYLFSIGRNLFVTACRKRAVEQRYADYLEYLDDINSTSTASSALEFDEYRKSFGQAVMSLPERQREIVRLSKFKAVKNSEIAKVLNLSEQTVKNQLSLGLKELRRLLAKTSPVLILLSNLFD